MRIAKYILFLAATLSFCVKAQAEDKKSIDLAGVWHAVADSEAGERELVWTIKKDGEGYEGISLDNDSGDERDLDRIKVKDGEVTIEVDIEADGNTGVIKVVVKQTAPGRLSGEWSIEDSGGNEYMSGDISAKKQVSYLGEWETIAKLPDGDELNSLLKIKGRSDDLEAVIHSSTGDVVEINKISTDADGIKLEFEFELDGNTMDCVIKAKSKDSGKNISGKWAIVDDSGNEEMTGDWSAARKAKSLAGTWKVSATVPNADDYEGTLELKESNGEYTGVSTNDRGEESKLKTVGFDGEKFSYTSDFERDGYEGVIGVDATLKNGVLTGEWHLTGSDGNEYAREEWKATRSE